MKAYPFVDTWVTPARSGHNFSQWDWSIERLGPNSRPVPFRGATSTMIPDGTDAASVASALQVLLAQRTATSPALAGYTPVEMMPPNQKLHTSLLVTLVAGRQPITDSSLRDMVPEAELLPHVAWFAPGKEPDVFGSAFLFANSAFGRGTQWRVGFVGVGDIQPLAAYWDDEAGLAEVFDFAELPLDAHLATLGLMIAPEYLVTAHTIHVNRTKVRQARAAFARQAAESAPLTIPTVPSEVTSGTGLVLGAPRKYEFLQSEVFGVEHSLPAVPSAFIYPIRVASGAGDRGRPRLIPVNAEPVPLSDAEALTERFASVLGGQYTVIRRLTGEKCEVGVIADLGLFIRHRDVFGDQLQDNIEVSVHGGWMRLAADSEV